MKIHAPVLAALALLALAGCDKPKPRHLPPDPMAMTPPPADKIAPPRAGITAGLAKLKVGPSFSIDRIGGAPDPLNQQPAVISAAQPVIIQGFGFDPVAKAPGKGVDVVVDGTPYGAAYGAQRPDVATYFKTPGVSAVGFTAILPAGALAVGPHKASVRVAAADGRGYFQSIDIPFEVR
jgi:hypothetical protein